MSEAVIRAWIGAGGVALGLAVGLGLAWVVPGRGGAVAPEPEGVAQVPAESASPGGSLVCASGPLGPEALRTRWCEAQLAAHASRTEMVRHAWPEDLGDETPDAWTAALERAVAECDLPFTLEVVECTEYPCLATVKGKGPLDTRDASWVAGCPPLAEAFAGGEIGLQDSRVRCPDGSLQDVWVFYAYQTETLSEVISDLVQDEQDDFVESFRLFGRRLDDVVTAHGCE